mmetsp:Transcript_74140/g.145528  ORF Transcript_74140/g.145528 Transcript_74140/m.145528 type:complete len:338 (+) Transcript_74140:99-1112(+)
MSLFRKVVSRSAIQLARAGKTSSPASFAQRSFSSMLEKREMGEEAKYIRSMEAQRQAEIRANVERILALEDGHEDKADLEKLLVKKDEKTGLAKYGLDQWQFLLPIGLFIGIPAIKNEVLVLDAETQLLACFILFCSTMYTQVGGMMGKSLDDYSTGIADELKAVDDTMLDQINASMAANQEAMTVEEDCKDLFQIQQQLAIAEADVLNQKEVHMYREAIVKKLDSLSALEESAVMAIRNRMLTKVKSDVINTFTNDQKAKDLAMTRAIEVLAGGAKGKMGKDVVGDVFAQALSNYKAEYAKMPEGSDPILKNLEKDMAAVAAAPVVESKGGNVYAR